MEQSPATSRSQYIEIEFRNTITIGFNRRGIYRSGHNTKQLSTDLHAKRIYVRVKRYFQKEKKRV